jgi:hypothetical protein
MKERKKTAMRPLFARAATMAVAIAAVAVGAATAAAASTGPVLSWAPATAGVYSYGTPPGGQAVAETFTLTNSGGSASSALTVTLAGSAAFTKTADTCTGTSLGPRKTCTVAVTYTAPQVPGQASQATLTATSNKSAGTANLALNGAAAKASPAITTTNSGGGPAGSTVTDTATLTGGDHPGGTIEFQLYPTADCSGSPVDDETVTVTGDGAYTTPTGYTSAPAGTYSWTASYSGDAANNATGTTCGTDTVTITKASPVITQVASANGSSGTTDTATLSGGDDPTGTIVFQLYEGSSNCSGTANVAGPVTVSGDGSYPGPGTTNFGNQGSWSVSYSGDANNNPAPASCIPA